MGTIIQSEKDISRLLDNTNTETSLLFDTGHIFFAQVSTVYVFFFKSNISIENFKNFSTF